MDMELYESALKRVIGLSGRVRKRIDSWEYFDKKGLGDQLMRALVSTASNMSEGVSRGGREEASFMRIAMGSAREAHTQIRIARSCGLLSWSNKEAGAETLEDAILWCELRLHELGRGNGNFGDKEDENA